MEWAEIPSIRPTNCAPGLERLLTVDMATLEINKELTHLVKNNRGEMLFKLKENAGKCSRKFCCRSSSFRLELFDGLGQEVVTMRHSFACNCCCFRPCCLQKLKVSCPPGTLIGKIKQKSSFRPSFTIKDSSGKKILNVEGPVSWCASGRKELKILNAQKEVVGGISTFWTSTAIDGKTENDSFGVKFPVDLDVQVKAILIGMSFLVEIMYSPM